MATPGRESGSTVSTKQARRSRDSISYSATAVTLGVLAWVWLGFWTAGEANGQGTVVFNTRIPAQTIHIWAPSTNNPGLALIGLGSNDTPSGTTPFGSASGMALIGAIGPGTSEFFPSVSYGYGDTFAQLIGAVGSNQPESALVPVGQTTTFRSGLALGDVAFIIDTLTGFTEGASATFEIVAWDNSSGLYRTWSQASFSWLYGYIAAGRSAPFTVTNLGGVLTSPPNLNNTQPITSFNLYYADAIPEYFFFPITIVSGPTNQNVAVGQSVTFGVTAASGPPMSYQWRFNGTDRVGATYTSFTIPSVQDADYGSYTVVITNGPFIGATSVTSDVALLTVYMDAGLRAHDGTGAIGLACEPPGQQTSPIRINKNGINYGIMLVATNAPNASKFRVQTSSGAKALQKLP
jgi:hypothetical protein